MSDDAVVNEANMRAMDEELSRWRRHGVLVTDDCGECGGTGECQNSVHEREKRGNPMHSPGMANPHIAFVCVGHCPVCDGSGKVLKDGAERLERYLMGIVDDFVMFPVSWLEGASDAP
jgi:hypothetical protein